MISLIYGILKKKRVQMNLSTTQEQSHGYRKQAYGYQAINWEIGADIYTYTTIYKIDN